MIRTPGELFDDGSAIDRVPERNLSAKTKAAVEELNRSSRMVKEISPVSIARRMTLWSLLLLCDKRINKSMTTIYILHYFD